MTEYDHTEYAGKEAENPMWEREYDGDNRKAVFYFYDNEKTAAYQSMTAYDETGKVIKESYYDMDGNPIRYYVNEYDDFGSVTRQAMYQDGILEYENK